MRVELCDGRCRTCGSALDIIDGSEDSLLVECSECGETYQTETDAFNDGCMTYLPAIMEKKFRKGVES